MAKATVDTVKKTVTETVEEEVVQLTLSKTEARVIRALTGMVTGSATTWAKEVRAVRDELSKVAPAYGPSYFTCTSCEVIAKPRDDAKDSF